MTGSLTRANALPPPMSPSLASSLAPRQKPETNAWLVTTLPLQSYQPFLGRVLPSGRSGGHGRRHVRLGRGLTVQPMQQGRLSLQLQGSSPFVGCIEPCDR